MKTILLCGLSLLALAACAGRAPAPTTQTDPVIETDECPRADGEPCR